MMTKSVYLITSGDLRADANRTCWPAQSELESRLSQRVAGCGYSLRRAFPVNDAEGHGFISSQRQGMDVFLDIPLDAPLIFATAAWQYSHHVLAGLRSRRGPILTVANWSGQWPGLVGLLNLNGSLIKAGVSFSTLWSEHLDDAFFLSGLHEWLTKGLIVHDTSHVRAFDPSSVPSPLLTVAQLLADELQQRKAIIGVFDEGCMGMYNAILDDELLNPMGIYKERLSQSALVARMATVSSEEADEVLAWLLHAGLTFQFGDDPLTHLARQQVLIQCKMYVAAVRIAAEFGCDAIGIQYQQGLKDVVPASDLVEGLLNNVARPPVYGRAAELLYPGQPLPHFNEVDECAGVDALITNRVWRALGLDPATTLHDLRWGEAYSLNGANEFVWVLQISGAAPASHLRGGYKGATSERQPAMYFPLGGGTLKGVGKPGEIVWSRLFQQHGTLHVDIGTGTVVELPEEETQRRWSLTTSQWPIVHTVFHGVSRDAMMARHPANHVNIAYAPSAQKSHEALQLKAMLFHQLGVQVHLCGQ